MNIKFIEPKNKTHMYYYIEKIYIFIDKKLLVTISNSRCSSSSSSGSCYNKTTINQPFIITSFQAMNDYENESFSQTKSN